MRKYVGIILPFLKVVAVMSGQAARRSTVFPKIYKSIPGVDDKVNDVIYHPPSDTNATATVVYFGGDVQDYPENMLSHRDNKHHIKWNLPSTATLLHSKFPTCHILLIRAVRMHLKSFACYDNFVESNNFGAPTHSVSLDSLKHLKCVIDNLMPIAQKETSSDIASDRLPIILIGFSKGCVVLNQLLYSFMALSLEPTKELDDFVQRISMMFWLDGAHSGSCNTWVTDKDILRNFAQLPIKIRIHVTPYQVHCDMRPRIGKEEKSFRETLRRFNADIERTLHFEDEPKSVDYHFQVLEAFRVVD